jgi:L-asparaginase/Glu-tRNA(Gln) amidotransferase subunit D
MTVQVLTTGGTIASTTDVTGSVSVSLPGAALVPPGVSVREVARRHSFAMSMPELLDLVTEILASWSPMALTPWRRPPTCWTC